MCLFSFIHSFIAQLIPYGMVVVSNIAYVCTYRPRLPALQQLITRSLYITYTFTKHSAISFEEVPSVIVLLKAKKVFCAKVSKECKSIQTTFSISQKRWFVHARHRIAIGTWIEFPPFSTYTIRSTIRSEMVDATCYWCFLPNL